MQNNQVLTTVTETFISGGIYTVIATDNDHLSLLTFHDNKGKCTDSQRDFNIQKYMGRWYQIASIPQFYERGCDRLTAEYTWLIDKINVFKYIF